MDGCAYCYAYRRVGNRRILLERTMTPAMKHMRGNRDPGELEEHVLGKQGGGTVIDSIHLSRIEIL